MPPKTTSHPVLQANQAEVASPAVDSILWEVAANWEVIATAKLPLPRADPRSSRFRCPTYRHRQAWT
jgi:hypothetical protein